jgi:hypothetical protein
MPQSSYPRNTFVYDAHVPQGVQPLLVAGFMQLGHTTGQEFYFYLEICFAEPRPGCFRLMNPTGNIVPRDGTIIVADNYYVVAAGLPLWFPI